MWNPQVMSDAKFNELVEEIRSDGFDEPLIVVPHPDPDKERDGLYMIINGEHRWQAARVIGYSELPAVVKLDWDDKDQRIKTVRRNLLHGDIDRQKFTKLVHSLSETGMPIKDMPAAMGFNSDTEFRDKFIQQEQDRRKTARNAAVKEAQDGEKREVEVVNNLSYILNEIFSQYGQNIPQGFIFFWHKSKFHLMIQETDKLEKSVEMAVKYARETGKHIAPLLDRAFGLLFDQVKEDEGVNPRKTRSISGKVEAGGDSDGDEVSEVEGDESDEVAET